MSTWLNGTSTVRTAAYFEAWLDNGVVPIGNYCTGDGSNEATSLQNAINDAAGKVLTLERNKTYVVGASCSIASGMRIDGNGATIKKTSALDAYALTVDANDVEIRDLTIHGNRTGGNTSLIGGIRWNNAGGIARRLKSINGKGAGVYVQGAGVLDAYDCESSDHVAGTGSGDGFQAAVGGLLRTYNCRGDGNGRCGFRFQATAAAGCRLDGTSNNCFMMGAEILSSSGTGGRFVSSNNKSYGLYASAASDWAIEWLDDADSGAALHGEYTVNPSATGVELFGCNHFVIHGRVLRPLGYGVALTQLAGVGTTASEIYVDVDHTGASDRDPAFHISGNSSKNFIKGTARGSTVAVSFGEGVAGDANDDNHVSVVAFDCSHSVLNVNAGSRNTFWLDATDCRMTAPYTSLARFTGADTTQNTVHWKSANPTTADPTYIMACDASATHNWLADGFARDYVTGILSEGGSGTNVEDLATAP